MKNICKERQIIIMKNIINIINFVRAVEPRVKDDSFLLQTFEEELKLCKKYNFKSTVLLQYDAFIKTEYIELLRKYSDLIEIGIWFEIVEPLVTDCGLIWRGRYPWDWHNDVGFLIGYTPEERAILIDKAFNKFNDIFGYFPKVIGSWHIDVYSLNYIDNNYDITASCNCKDQFGTDGYSLWGGYYNGAYYPCKNNMICPGATKESQISFPVFRMLGSDPLRQYDIGIENPNISQSVVSLEPVYPDSGANEEWVKWYLKENFNGKGISFSYTQAGQENSFGWDRIGEGLKMQFELFSNKLKNNEIEIITLGEAGEWFKENFETTPPASICIDSDYSDDNCKTVWYYSKNYRTNIFFKNGTVRIRDLFIFNENFKEKYIDQKELTDKCGYYNLPVTDGYRFSRENDIAGIYVCNKSGIIKYAEDFITSTVGNNATAEIKGKIKFTMQEDKIIISSDSNDWFLEFHYSKACDVPYNDISDKELIMNFKGETDNYFNYSLITEKGLFKNCDKIRVYPENNKIIFLLKQYN